MSDHPPLPTTTTAAAAATTDSTTTTTSSSSSSSTTSTTTLSVASPSAALRAALSERYGLDPLDLEVMGRDELVGLVEAMQAEEAAQVGMAG